MMIKVAFATVAAAALCAPAIASAPAASGPAVANVAYSVPASFSDFSSLDKKKKCKSGGLVNVSCNSVQVPVQACNNNILNNIGIGILGGHGSAKGGNSKGKCSQSTKSK